LRSIVSRHVKQSAIPDLSAHFGVKRRSIENDVELARLFARQNRLDNRFSFQKVITEKLRWLGFQLSFFDTDLFLFLSLTSALTLFIHQLFKSGNVDREPVLSRH